MRVATALLLVELSLAGVAQAASVAEGRAAYDDNKVAEAEKIYAAVVGDRSAGAAERSAAERELARIAWLIDGDADRAMAHLRAARSIGDKPCMTAEYAARVLREAHRFATTPRDALHRSSRSRAA